MQRGLHRTSQCVFCGVDEGVALAASTKGHGKGKAWEGVLLAVVDDFGDATTVVHDVEANTFQRLLLVVWITFRWVGDLFDDDVDLPSASVAGVVHELTDAVIKGDAKVKGGLEVADKIHEVDAVLHSAFPLKLLHGDIAEFS